MAIAAPTRILRSPEATALRDSNVRRHRTVYIAKTAIKIDKPDWMECLPDLCYEALWEAKRTPPAMVRARASTVKICRIREAVVRKLVRGMLFLLLIKTYQHHLRRGLRGVDDTLL